MTAETSILHPLVREALENHGLDYETVIGLPATIPVYVDQRVMERDRIIVGGGNRTSKVRLHLRQLEGLPNVRVADVALLR